MTIEQKLHRVNSLLAGIRRDLQVEPLGNGASAVITKVAVVQAEIGSVFCTLEMVRAQAKAVQARNRQAENIVDFFAKDIAY